MASTATVTAKTGPAASLTSTVINNVSEIVVKCGSQVIDIFYNGNLNKVSVDVSANTTSTLTNSGGNYTLTLS